MFYLSRLINVPIVDADGIKLGIVGDVAVDLRETLPPVIGVWMRGDRSRVAIIPWDDVATVGLDEVRLRVPRRALHPRPLQPEDLLLADVLDTQVVDTDGLKVVRVNDLQLKPVDSGLRLVAADVGTTGLLRRLNLEHAVQRIAGLMRHPLRDRLIPWTMVAAFGGSMTPVKLRISRDKLREIHPADLGDLMGDLSRDDRVEVMTALRHEDAAEALAEAEPNVQSDVMQNLPSELAADILQEMAPDDATDVLTDLPRDRAVELINLMEPEEAQEVKELLKYPEGSAGSVMTTEFIALPEALIVQATIERLRAEAQKTAHVSYLYVINTAQRLVGVLSLRALITAPPQQQISTILNRDVISLSVHDNVEVVAAALTKYDLLALPVLDDAQHLVGIVTVDDVMDIVLRKGRRRVPLRFRRRAKKVS